MHLHDIACAEAKAGEQKEYGPVPLANARSWVAGCDEALHIFGRQISRKRGQTPTRYDGNCTQQVRTAATLCDQKPQEHT